MSNLKVSPQLLNFFRGNKAEYVPKIADGEKVKLNVQLIKSRKDFLSAEEEYKAFVNECDGKIVTAHHEKGCIFSLEENPRWYFVESDLIQLEN